MPSKAGTTSKCCKHLNLQAKGQNLALTVFYVPFPLDSGRVESRGSVAICKAAENFWEKEQGTRPTCSQPTIMTPAVTGVFRSEATANPPGSPYLAARGCFLQGLLRASRPNCRRERQLQAFRCKATWKRELKLPWREVGPPYHHDDKVDSDQ